MNIENMKVKFTEIYYDYGADLCKLKLLIFIILVCILKIYDYNSLRSFSQGVTHYPFVKFIIVWKILLFQYLR